MAESSTENQCAVCLENTQHALYRFLLPWAGIHK
uniref:Uncharacterized protein n=1 Tax=Rhizophora mucronata TaxID=61149 RepID=A0A2P2KSK6_RHIMU